jgi:hypothetical protein
VKQYATIGETVFFWLVVKQEEVIDAVIVLNAAQNDHIYTPIADLAITAESSKAYKIPIAATAENGFTGDNSYVVMAMLVKNKVKDVQLVGSFDLKPVQATIEPHEVTAMLASTSLLSEISKRSVSALSTRNQTNRFAPSRTK